MHTTKSSACSKLKMCLFQSVVIVAVVCIAHISYGQQPQDPKKLKVRFGKIDSISVPLQTILDNPGLTTNEPGCEVVKFSLMILPTGGEIQGPFTRTGSKIGPNQISMLKEFTNTKARLFFDDIYVKCKGQDTIKAPIGVVLTSHLESLHKDDRWAALCAQVKENKDKAEENLNKPLVAILDTVMQTDQEYRMQLDGVEKEYGRQSKEMSALWKTISMYDSINVLKVTAIIDKYGWQGRDVVGASGNEAVFLVIQHADSATQDKYLPVMREAVKNKKAQPSALALLEDRVALKHGKMQTYGSQITGDANGMFLAPLTDPDNVDKRRAEVGLEPLAEYLKSFQMTWNVEEYKKQLPDIEKRAGMLGYH